MSKKLVCLASSVLAFGTVLTSITQAGLVGWWRFNEGSGNVASDSSGNNHDGALLGTPEWVAGPDGFGGALAFDPDGCIGMDCGVFDPTNGTGQFTLALWAFWDGTGAIQHFLTKSNGWGADTMMFQVELWAANSSEAHRDRVGISYQPVGSVPFCIMPQDEWVHLAWTFDGTNARVYLNGVDEEGPKALSIGPDVDAQVEIGYNSNRATPSERTFHGPLDDVRIYDYALTETEVQIVMQGGGGFPNALGPTPANGAIHQDMGVSLSWRP
ncbi:MAG: LamG domain-containing protein, partial [Planctomycetota bacterium]